MAGKLSIACAILTILPGVAWCDDQATPGGTNSVRGFIDAAVATPHNEIDTGLCTLARGDPYPNTTCSAFARYVWDGYLELQPIRRTPLRRLFLILEPKILAGNNIPQYRYTASAAPILWELNIGGGLELPRQFELRYTYHKAFLLGRYSGAVNQPILPDGPYGRNSTLGVRWNFGGRDRSATPAPRTSARLAEFRGRIDFDVALPHDEVDLGLCTAAAGSAASAACAAYARYVWSGYLEVQPGRVTHTFHRLSFFVEPILYAGNNVPQQRYTADASLILCEISEGVAVELSTRFELRFTHHDVHPLARYSGAESASTLLSSGPYGNNATLGLRWYFGGWRHASVF
jgi:hypothetical protein